MLLHLIACSLKDVDAEPLATRQTGRSAEDQSYRPQLDALRTFAVGAVLYTHFWSQGDIGHQGVRLFFVISGFLITGILLKLKDQREQPLGAKLWTFYARRSLRIWPTYYLVLLAAWLAAPSGMRPSIPWHLTYTSNFYFIREGAWDPWATSHLWSLSVEEQFYLAWPLIVLSLSERRLMWVIAAAIVGAVAFRLSALLAWTEGSNGIAAAIATPASFDALGMGASLAVAKKVGWLSPGVQKWLWVASAACLAAYLLLIVSPLSRWEGVYKDLLFAVVFTSIVRAADRGLSGPIGALLQWRPIVFLGRISYGIYLYHLFVVYAVSKAGVRVGVYITHEQPWAFLIFTSLTILAATASWYLIERPIASLKRYLPYAREANLEASRQQTSF